MIHYARGRSAPVRKVWTYSPGTLSYKEASVSGFESITTVKLASRTSKPRLKANGSYSAPISASYPSSRTVDWQAQAYQHAMESGEWAAYLTDDEARYRDRYVTRNVA